MGAIGSLLSIFRGDEENDEIDDVSWDDLKKRVDNINGLTMSINRTTLTVLFVVKQSHEYSSYNITMDDEYSLYNVSDKFITRYEYDKVYECINA